MKTMVPIDTNFRKYALSRGGQSLLCPRAAIVKRDRVPARPFNRPLRNKPEHHPLSQNGRGSKVKVLIQRAFRARFKILLSALSASAAYTKLFSRNLGRDH